MEKLYELHEERDFDLVVVDTPPTRNALDFLDAPRRLTRFLDHRLYRILMTPTRGYREGRERGRPGVPAHGVEGRRRRRDRRRHRVLPGLRRDGGRASANGPSACSSCSSAPETAFVLVASPRRDTVEEATFFADQLAEGRHPGRGARSSTACTRGSATASPRPRASGRGTLAGTDLGGLYANLADFAARRRARGGPPRRPRRAGRRRRRWCGCRSCETDVHDLDGLDAIAAHLFR